MRKATAWLLLLALVAGFAFAQQTQLQNTKHNLSTSGTGSIKSAAAGGTTEICVFCHTPHGSSAVAQLWNHAATGANYTLYASDYLTSLGYPGTPTGSPTAPDQPKTRSKLCLSCHDGTIALGSVYNLPGSGGYSPTPGPGIPMAQGGIDIPGGKMPTNAAGFLGNNLTDDHPIGYMYDAAKDAELKVRVWPWNTAVKLDPNSSTGTVECQTCHEPHNNQYTKFLRMQITNGELTTTYLCTHCHDKAGYSISGHGTSLAPFTPAGGTATTVRQNSCLNCHKPHSSGGTPYVLRAVEESTCYESGCHGTLNPGTNTTPAERLIQPELSKTHRHPVDTYSGRHKNRKFGSTVDGGKETKGELSDGSNRHAECTDCHNPHQARAAVATTTRGGLRISEALKGVWGVQPIWPAAPAAMATNAVSFAPIVTYNAVEAPADEYQICLKCHSNYVTLPAGARNIAQEINPNNWSYHGIVPPVAPNPSPPRGSNPNVTATTAYEPWATNKRVWCSDCHRSEAGSGVSPKGPHGSNLNGTGPGTSNTDKMLVATIATGPSGGTPLCLVCHKSTSYLTGSTGSNSSRHGADTTLARAPQGCFSCHMWENPAVVTAGTGKIFPHGMNKRWALVGTGPDAGSLQMIKAFNGGWYTNMDYTQKKCWTTTTLTGKTVPSGSPCNAHAAVGY